MPRLSTAFARFQARPTPPEEAQMNWGRSGVVAPLRRNRRRVKREGREQVQIDAGFILIGEPFEFEKEHDEEYERE